MSLAYRMIVALLALLTSAGCKDRYAEGYHAGYAVGMNAGERVGYEKGKAERPPERYTSRSDYNSVSTEVCGGGGVTHNGKHIRPGKTGCVRVLSDGSVQRY